MTNTEPLLSLLPECENLRKKALFFFVLDIILAALLGLGGFACIILGAILDLNPEFLKGIFVGLGFLFFLGGTSAFSLLAIHTKNHFKEHFESTFAPLFSDGVYEDYHFVFAKPIEALKKQALLPFKEKPDEEDTSYSEGRIKDTSFFAFSYQHMKAKDGHPDNANGLYVELTLKEAKEAEILLLAKKGKKMFSLPEEKECFESESIAFNDRYALSSNSQLLALQVVTPAFIDGINTLAKEEGGNLSLYLKGSRLVVYFDDYPAKEISLGHSLTVEDLKAFQNEVLLPSKIINALHL
jgi:hypothetical protein